jgi:hypothetical protein
MRAFEPVPFRDEWAPSYLQGRPGAKNIDKAFTLSDAQGMPGGPAGSRVHGGWDLFAPAGTPIVAPVGGVIVRADESSDHYGPVYGGVIGLAAVPGPIGFVFRHVDPARPVGAVVRAGELIGYVFDWHSGGDHVHMEVHRVIGSGRTYAYSNAVDPATIAWVPNMGDPIEPAPEPEWGVEILPMNLGGVGPDVYGGWSSRATRRAAWPKIAPRYDPEDVNVAEVRLVGAGAPFGIRVTRKGRPGIPRWIRPTKTERDLIAADLRAQGHRVRLFRGRANSLYSRLP